MLANIDGKCERLVYNVDLIISHPSPERMQVTKFLNMSQIVWDECPTRKISAPERPQLTIGSQLL